MHRAISPSAISGITDRNVFNVTGMGFFYISETLAKEPTETGHGRKEGLFELIFSEDFSTTIQHKSRSY